jgi:hypothetical protein
MLNDYIKAKDVNYKNKPIIIDVILPILSESLSTKGVVKVGRLLVV